jgi:S1-C subfamily serine protease
VSVVEQNDTRNPDIGTADYLVWYQVRTIQPDNTGAWLAHWQIRRAGSDAITGAAMDPGVAAGTPRYASFVKSVRDGALRLGGTSLAGGIAGTQPTGDKSRRVVGSGSGIIIDSQGHIVTNNHVVATCPELRVIDAANENVAAAVVARDATNDLALLKATHHWPVMASFREGGDLRQGEQVVVAGYPLGTLLSSNMSVTTGSLTSLTGPRDDSRLLQVTAPVQPGNSGGPLLDGSGAVIGVVTGTLNGMVLAVATGAIPQNVNFALKAAVVRTFLDTNRIGWTKASARSELTAADIGDIARKFTVRVECRR